MQDCVESEKNWALFTQSRINPNIFIISNKSSQGFAW